MYPILEFHYTLNLTRFYEPFIIVHDFAQTLDLEIDTSRKKHIHKSPLTTGSTAVLRAPLSNLWTRLHKLITLPDSDTGHEIALSAVNTQLLVITARPRAKGSHLLVKTRNLSSRQVLP